MCHPVITPFSEVHLTGGFHVFWVSSVNRKRIYPGRYRLTCQTAHMLWDPTGMSSPTKRVRKHRGIVAQSYSQTFRPSSTSTSIVDSKKGFRISSISNYPWCVSPPLGYESKFLSVVLFMEICNRRPTSLRVSYDIYAQVSKLHIHTILVCKKKKKFWDPFNRM